MKRLVRCLANGKNRMSNRRYRAAKFGGSKSASFETGRKIRALPVGRLIGNCPTILYLILDLLNENAIIEICQLGWSLSRLKHRPLIVALHPLSPLLATVTENPSNPRHHRKQPQFISIPSSVALTPLLSILLPTPTP